MSFPMPTVKVEDAIRDLNDGNVILYPTDTVYGLGCKINNKEGISRIYKIKGREENNPLSVAFSDIEQLSQYADISDNEKRTIVEKLKEKPYTFIVKKKEGKISNFISKTDAIGVRIPDHPFVREICSKAGPIISTSANKSGENAPATLEDIAKEIICRVDLILIGECKYGKPSTVYDLINDKIIRE